MGPRSHARCGIATLRDVARLLSTLAWALIAAPAFAQAPAPEPAETAHDAAPPGDAAPTTDAVPSNDAAPTTDATAKPIDEAARGRLSLLETHAIGVDPIVGRVLNRELRKAAEALGYEVSGTEQSRETMQALEASYPPTMADLWRIAHRAQTERAVLAVVWASGGRYVVQIRVASLDGSGPDYAQADVGADDLTERVPSLLGEALAPPGETLPPKAERDLEADAAEGRSFFLDEDTSSRLTPRLRRLRLALHGDSAFGIADDGFFNQLVGLRLDYRFGEELSLGAYLGYANLRGRDDRVSSLLPYVQLDNRVPIVPGGSVAIPLRVGLGYLVRNGMFLRLSAGLALPLGDRVELVFDLLTPTFWLTPNATLFSLDLGVELALKI
jgi:hypothetical protein